MKRAASWALAALHRAYLRMRIRSAEKDIRYFEREQYRARSPEHAKYFRDQAAVTRQAIGLWRCEIGILGGDMA